MKKLFEKFFGQKKEENIVEKSPVALDLPKEGLLKQESSSKKERKKSPFATPEEAILETREKRDSKPLWGGCNQSLFVNLKDDGAGVFKPKNGECKHLREHVLALSYYKRERAAYLVSRFLGFDFVPTTTIRELDGEEGSIQEFIEDAQSGFEADRPFDDAVIQELFKMWIFDYIIYNSDRHGGNFLVKGNWVYAIDNGLAFGADSPKFFEVFFDQPIPEELIGKIKKFISWEEGRDILKDLLLELLSPDEVEACFKRIEKISQLVGVDNIISSADSNQLTFS